MGGDAMSDLTKPFDHRITMVALELYRLDGNGTGNKKIDFGNFHNGGQVTVKYAKWAEAVLAVVDSFPPPESKIPARIDISIIPGTGEISAHTHGHPFYEWDTTDVEVRAITDDANWSTCPTCGAPVFRQDLWSHQGGTPPTDHEAEPTGER
jgi:hypothetical protein